MYDVAKATNLEMYEIIADPAIERNAPIWELQVFTDVGRAGKTLYVDHYI